MKYLFTTAALALGLAVSAAAAPLPQVVSKDGRHALLVDGAPFLILGGQANNSSNYPAVLPQVWPVIHAMHANTLEIPVAWEQIEPLRASSTSRGSTLSYRSASQQCAARPFVVRHVEEHVAKLHARMGEDG